MTSPAPLPVVLAFTHLIDTLFDVLAARYGKFPIAGRVFLFIWQRFDRVKRRFARLAARFARGTLRPAARTRHAGARRARARVPAPPDPFLLRRFVNPTPGWLCRVAPGTSDAARHLRDLLTTDPDMRAMLAASPATARALRPLCRMLGIVDALPKPPPPAPPVAATDGPTTVSAMPAPDPFAPAATRAASADRAVPPRPVAPPPRFFATG